MYLAYVIFVALLGCTDAGVNVAVGKPATQSSFFSRPSSAAGVTGEQPSGVAVDGVPLPESCSELKASDGLFSHTETLAKSWWRVDLEKVYYIYRITICNRGKGTYVTQRLNGAQVLTSVTENPRSPSIALSDWTQIYTVPSPAGEFREQSYNASISTRHVAVFKSAEGYGVTLREVTVEGFSQDDINTIAIQHSVEDRTPFNMTIKANLNGYNKTVFESTRLVLTLVESDGRKQVLQNFPIMDGEESINFHHIDLTPSTTYFYEIRLLTYDMVMKTETFQKATTAFTCREPQKAGGLNVAQSIDHQNKEKPIKLSISWQVPGKTGCEPWTNQVLTYITSVNGTTYNSTNLSLDVNVKAYTNYGVSVRAVNHQEMKSVWSTLDLKSISAAPTEAPSGISLLTVNKTCVNAGWFKAGSNKNGPITKYEITCKHNGTDLDIKKEVPAGTLPISVDICGFSAGTEVKCDVTAFTSNNQTYNRGPASEEVSTTTHINLDIFVPQEEEVIPEVGGIFPVPLPAFTPPENADVVAYKVIVTRKTAAEERGRKRRASQSCSYQIIPERAGPTTFDPLLNFTEAADCSLDYYLAAILTEAPPAGYRFPVGDGLMYNGVRNVLLEKGSGYDVYYGVDVRIQGQTDVVVQVLDGSIADIQVPLEDITASPDPEIKDSKDGMSSGAIAGIVVVSLLVGILAVLLVLFLRKRNLQQNNKSSSETSLSSIDALHNVSTSNDYVQPPEVQPRPPRLSSHKESGSPRSNNSSRKNSAKQRTKRVRDTQIDYENVEVPMITEPRDSEPIPVEKLKWYTQSNSDLILRQYEKLNQLPHPDSSIAQTPQNRPKCRYKDLYPGNDFRVTLKRLPSQGSDFINASYMAGYHDDKKFIAAQGPTEVNELDFWLMIWQQNIKHIVMVTRLFETNKMKCVKYWPDKGDTTTKGDLTIRTTTEDEWTEYTIRQLHVTKDGEGRTITHYQFTAWPDHDVPQTSEPLLSFMRKVPAFTDKNRTSPILTHCSAGVGRTGAIISLDYLQEQAAAESRVDFYKCVVKMRERRPNMIQTQDQYMFVHKALNDALNTKNFKTTAGQLVKKSGNITLLTEEFQYINDKLSGVRPMTDSATLPENKPLNRVQSILPDDKYRIYINSRDGQTYINAVRVNSFKEQDQFYVTQIPLKKTIKDFWQLVHDRSSRVIIQFGDTKDKVMFYPEDPAKGYSYADGTHIVTTKSVQTRGQLQIYSIEHAIEKKNVMKDPPNYKETTEVTLIKLPQSYCKDSRIQPEHILAITEQIVKLTNNSEHRNVVLCSNDGASLIGMFICAFNCIQLLQQTQEIEVYIQVLQARQRRKEFISSVEEYKALYEILLTYMDQFSQYENM